MHGSTLQGHVWGLAHISRISKEMKASKANMMNRGGDEANDTWRSFISWTNQEIMTREKG